MPYLTTLEGDPVEMFEARGIPRPSRAPVRRRVRAVNPASVAAAVAQGYPMRAQAMRTAEQTPGNRWRPADGVGFRSRCIYIRRPSGSGRDPDSLEGWWTDLKRGTSKAVSAIGDAGSAVIRPVASVGADVLRTVVPIAGRGIGEAMGAAFGTTGMGASLQGLIPGGGGAGAAPGGGTGGPIIIAGQPIDPKLLYIGGGVLLLVLLTRK